MEQQSIERFRSYLASRLGLQFEAGALVDLESVLEQRLQRLGYDHSAPYFQYLDSPAANQTELRALAEQLTVGETYFFRNRNLIDAFSEIALVNRVQARSSQRRLRILSAGCASGEEPYTLAMVVRDRLPDLTAWDIDIRGIDINHSLIEKARNAEYSQWSLRETPADAKARYFRQAGSAYAVAGEIREMVAFEERNLFDEDASFWRSETYDVIFCRNVMIYFAPEAIQELIARFERCLVPGGYLFLGHSETLRGISSAFDLCHTHDAFYYCRRSQISAGTPIRSFPVEETDSWADTIQKASARIAALAHASISDSPGTAGPPGPLGLSIGRIDNTERALELFGQDRFDDALRQLDQQHSESVDDCDALLIRAAVLTNRGELIEAEKVCAQVLRLDGLNAGAHYLSAVAREHAHDRSGALRDAHTAAYLDRSFAMPHLQIGFIAKRAGDRQTARQEFRLALSLLAREDPARILLFGGGFNREALIQLCRSELHFLGGRRDGQTI